MKECTAAGDVLLVQAAPPRPMNAVAALLVLQDGRYVMQLRDAVPGIFYPGHWGCFGGGVEAGESPLDALHRELREELEFQVGQAQQFSRFEFDFSPLGYFNVFRIYFEVPVSESEFGRFVLREGAELRAFQGQDLLAGYKVTPYDAFAIWMHLSRARFGTAR